MSEQLKYLADRAKGMLTERQARIGVLSAWEADHMELAEGVSQLLALVDSLQAALADKTEYFDIKQKQVWHLAAERDSLQQQLAERDRTIAFYKEGEGNLVKCLETQSKTISRLREALEEIASEEMMIGSAPVKMRHIARKALGRE